MNSPLDSQITATAASEATYLADVANVATIQTSIATATTPLAPAQTQLLNDEGVLYTNLQTLSALALSYAATLAPPPPAAAPAPA